MKKLNDEMKKVVDESRLTKKHLAKRSGITTNYLSVKLTNRVNRAFARRLLNAMVSEAKANLRTDQKALNLAETKLAKLDDEFDEDGIAYSADNTSASSASKPETVKE